MCLIVDSDSSHELISNPASARASVVLSLVRQKKIKFVYGGLLKRELFDASEAVRRFFIARYRDGTARQIPDELVNDLSQKIRSDGLCASRDYHVLALALISKARVLMTNDKALMSDFTNRSIVANPRGKVYSKANQSRLLKDCDDC